MNYFNYFSEIEDAFNRRRGKHLFLSPLDWALIDVWKEQGIPLHIVLRGIDVVFDGVERDPRRKRSVKSLMYCREEVEAQFAEWSEARVGGHDDDAADTDANESEGFSADVITAHLTKIREELNSAAASATDDLKESIARVIAMLGEVGDSYKDAESLDSALNNFEEILNESLLRSEDRSSVEKNVAGQLSQYRSKMDKEAYDRTLEMMLLKALRDRAGLPRLGLFYI